MNPDALAMLPEDGDLSGLLAVSLNSTNEDGDSPPKHEDVDPYRSHLSGSFVPSATQRRTE